MYNNAQSYAQVLMQLPGGPGVSPLTALKPRTLFRGRPTAQHQDVGAAAPALHEWLLSRQDQPTPEWQQKTDAHMQDPGAGELFRTFSPKLPSVVCVVIVAGVQRGDRGQAGPRQQQRPGELPASNPCPDPCSTSDHQFARCQNTCRGTHVSRQQAPAVHKHRVCIRCLRLGAMNVGR